MNNNKTREIKNNLSNTEEKGFPHLLNPCKVRFPQLVCIQFMNIVYCIFFY